MINYDPTNKNEEVLSELGFPQRFGFPVFVVLDGKGNRIHTQNSAFFEKDKDYDRDRVMKFLNIGLQQQLIQILTNNNFPTGKV